MGESVFSTLIAPICAGVVFGYALHSGRVSVPYTIVSQMEMQNFTMMRMFLAASGIATISISILHNLGIYERTPKPSKSLGFGLMKGYGGNVVGGLLLGAGMYLAGACPGTLWAQIGALHSVQQLYVLLGGITGAIVFGYAHKLLKGKLTDFQKQNPVPFTDEPTKVDLLGILYFAMIIGTIGALDYYLPWKEQLASVLGSYDASRIFGDGSFNPITAVAWDPMIAGIIVGLMQFPSVLSMGNSFGSSASWVYFGNRIMTLVDPNLEENAPYLYAAQNSVIAKWQAVCCLGAIAGSFASTALSQPAFPACTPMGISPVRAFIGGFILIFGSRLGGGCTSGHGLSGMATGSLGSVVSVGSMFVGGMGMSLVLNPSALMSYLK